MHSSKISCFLWLLSFIVTRYRKYVPSAVPTSTMKKTCSEHILTCKFSVSISSVTSSTPNPCQSSWKLLSSKEKVITYISVSHKAMAPAELLNTLSLWTWKFLLKKKKKRKSDKLPYSAPLTHICYHNLLWENNEDIFHYRTEACDRAGSNHITKLDIWLSPWYNGMYRDSNQNLYSNSRTQLEHCSQFK